MRLNETERHVASADLEGRSGRPQTVQRIAPSLLEEVLPEDLKCLGGLFRAVEDPDADARQVLLPEERQLRGEGLVVLVPSLDEAVALGNAVPRRLLVRVELAAVLLGVGPSVRGGERAGPADDARERLVGLAVPLRAASIVGD